MDYLQGVFFHKPTTGREDESDFPINPILLDIIPHSFRQFNKSILIFVI